MADACYNDFDHDGLQRRTSPIEAALLQNRLQNRVVSMYSKKGLHRSKCGARFTAERLAADGHRATWVSLGCASRLWAMEFVEASMYASTHTQGLHVAQE